MSCHLNREYLRPAVLIPWVAKDFISLVLSTVPVYWSGTCIVMISVYIDCNWWLEVSITVQFRRNSPSTRTHKSENMQNSFFRPSSGSYSVFTFWIWWPVNVGKYISDGHGFPAGLWKPEGFCTQLLSSRVWASHTVIWQVKGVARNLLD